MEDKERQLIVIGVIAAVVITLLFIGLRRADIGFYGFFIPLIFPLRSIKKQWLRILLLVLMIFSLNSLVFYFFIK